MTTYSYVFMASGFFLASYSIVANDAIQTLGTFLSSNNKRPWWALWLYASFIMIAVIVFSWVTYDGDVSYGRLSNKFPVPTQFSWIHVVPPLVLLFLTRKGIPVSTTFLILTVFSGGALVSMLQKSIAGYAVAFTAGLIVYWSVANIFEQKMISTNEKPPHKIWIVLQWISTGFLWSQWLIQDLANIYVYMPDRQLSLTTLVATLILLTGIHGIIFYSQGGEIQKIVTSKTNAFDIRSATIIDLIYAFILLIFAKFSNIPMSTTWVFLGLLAGREIAITIRLNVRSLKDTVKIVQSDGFKAVAGLTISVVLALILPWLDQLLN